MWYVPGLVFGCVRRRARAEIAAQKLRLSGERSKQAFLSASYSLRHFCAATWDPGKSARCLRREVLFWRPPQTAQEAINTPNLP